MHGSSASIRSARDTLAVGATFASGITTFSVWAPDHQVIELVVGEGTSGVRPLTRDEDGCWSGAFDDLGPGTLYRFRIDRSPDRTFPDPASRFQPRGVHGPSQVVDHASFRWSDHEWQPPALDRLSIYELHVGTFTPAGTFEAAAERLDYLADLGVTAVELMPIGDFPGERNWGYDGVALYAPARCYGTPDALRALVDRAHRLGLAVILDVVYNHFGPDGAYASAFSPYYWSDRHDSPWGRGLNFDGPHSAQVRRFFAENALQWVRDYHVDALRLDATHAIVDDTRPHVLAELTSTVRAQAGRHVIFIAEDHRNLARMMAPVESGGYGIDAVWADDLHHQARVHTAGDRDGYYADFTGSVPDLVATLRQGWFFTGQTSSLTDAPRGTDPSRLSPPQFVHCIQNHDQIGNRFDGARLNHQIDPAAYRALSALLLVSPHTPLLFMGQEWAAGSPFQFFTDHSEELGRAVTQGRRAEFAAFRAFAADVVPDPQAEETFLRSRLAWDERTREPHAGILRLYRQLLQLRRTHPALQAPGRGSFEVRAVEDSVLTLQRWSADRSSTLIAVVRLSGEGVTRIELPRGVDTPILSTEDAAFVEDPQPIGVSDNPPAVELHRPGAIFLTNR